MANKVPSLASLLDVAPPVRRATAGSFKPGHPKLGGRQKGVLNRQRSFGIAQIVEMSNPVQFLCRVVNGEEFEVAPEPGSKEVVLARPTMADRIAAAKALSDKVLPSLKSVQADGALAQVAVLLQLSRDAQPAPPQ